MRIMMGLYAAAIAGCVIAPTDKSEVVSRLDTVSLDGYAAVAGAPMQLRSWNYQRNAWEPLRDFTASGDAVGRDTIMYAWSSHGVLTGSRYWVPPGAPCSTGGMGRFQVRERSGSVWYTLATFDAGGMACLEDQVAAGADFYDAGVACQTGDNVLLFSPGACVTVAASDPTAPTVVLRVTDDVRAWELKNGDLAGVGSIAVPVGRTLHLRADVFDLQGPHGVQIDFDLDVLCHSTTFGDYLVASVNRAHGEQDTATGATVAGAVGAEFDITRAVAAGLCHGGDTLRSASVDLTATGFNARGASVSTAPMSFAIAY